MKILAILFISIVACLLICLMKKIAPEDKAYPIWALFVVILFSITILNT